MGRCPILGSSLLCACGFWEDLWTLVTLTREMRVQKMDGWQFRPVIVMYKSKAVAAASEISTVSSVYTSR